MLCNRFSDCVSVNETLRDFHLRNKQITERGGPARCLSKR